GIDVVRSHDGLRVARAVARNMIDGLIEGIDYLDRENQVKELISPIPFGGGLYFIFKDGGRSAAATDLHLVIQQAPYERFLVFVVIMYEQALHCIAYAGTLDLRVDRN